MLAEIRASKPDLNVEILGINHMSDSAFNNLVVPYRVLPWLQDTSEQNVWSTWDVEWRDVWIVDSHGRPFAVYNLSSHDLGEPSNREALKQLFLSAAQIVDTDKDRLPDDWEMRHFASLVASDSADSDRDGCDNFSEYAFGTSPVDAGSRPVLTPGMLVKAQENQLQLTYRARAGAIVEYRLEETLQVNSFGVESATLQTRQARNLFDGTGTLEIIDSVPIRSWQAFFRVRALPRR
jgi:hypothetical protein